MIYKNAVKTMFLAAFLFAADVSAQEQKARGIFYTDCLPSYGAVTTIETDTHLRITVFKPALVTDEAYRTKEQVFEGEAATMEVGLCPAEQEVCRAVEGVLTVYKADGAEIEAAIEYFDGTETQGDAESVQGPVTHFKVSRDKDRPVPECNR